MPGLSSKCSFFLQLEGIHEGALAIAVLAKGPLVWAGFRKVAGLAEVFVCAGAWRIPPLRLLELDSSKSERGIKSCVKRFLFFYSVLCCLREQGRLAGNLREAQSWERS